MLKIIIMSWPAGGDRGDHVQITLDIQNSARSYNAQYNLDAQTASRLHAIYTLQSIIGTAFVIEESVSIDTSLESLT